MKILAFVLISTLILQSKAGGFEALDPEPDAPWAGYKNTEPWVEYDDKIPSVMSEDLLNSLELESDNIRRSTIMRHLQNYKDTEISLASIFPVAMDYFYKMPYEKFELLDVKVNNHDLDLLDEDEVDHAHLTLLKKYLIDNYEGKSEMSIDDAVIMLSWEKYNAFTDRWLQNFMTEKDFVGIHKAGSMKGDLLWEDDFAMDKDFDTKSLLADVRKDRPFVGDGIAEGDLEEGDLDSDM
jgi:hypothetical protein